MRFLSVFNPAGTVIAAALLLPYILFMRSHPDRRANVSNRAMLYIAWLGKYGSLLLMCVHIGVLEQGFTEPKALMERFWWITSAALLVVCAALWAMLWKKPRLWLMRLIAALSASIVVLSGILQVNTLLFTFGFVLLAGELYLIAHSKE